MKRIIDVNVSLGRWPFQKFALNTPAALERHLRQEGIASAWVSAVESILFPDPDVYDERLFRKLQRHRALCFVKTVNPTLGNWRESLERWTKRRGIRAVKLFPNYHGYSLEDECVAEMMKEIRARRLLLLVQMRVNDERNQYPLMQVPGVPADDIVALAAACPRVSIVALCPYLVEAKALGTAGPNLHVDLSFIETIDTLTAALEMIPARRILFGSHTPFLTTRSEVMKLELSTAPTSKLRMIASDNAARLLRA